MKPHLHLLVFVDLCFKSFYTLLRKTFTLLFIIFSIQNSRAQLAGSYTVPCITYPTISSIVSTLNTVGVSAPVTINILAGHTETAPVGGIQLSATGSSVNTITFQKSGAGANPLITAYTGGTGTPTSAVQDGIWQFVGSDYITIDGIDLLDPNVSNPSTMEYGYGFFKVSGTNGCQNNTIKNCVVTLNRINNAYAVSPSAEGSRGIHLFNTTVSTSTTNITISSAAGSNSYNSFFSNTIQNCNIGMALIGYSYLSSLTLADVDNNVGGASAITSNTIINFGGATSATNIAAGIKTFNQRNINVSYNIINSNNGGGVNHPYNLSGINLGSAPYASSTIHNNTVTIKGGGTTHSITAIENGAGSVGTTNTISICNNLITDCSYPTVTSAFYFLINNASGCGNLNVSNNIFLNNTCNSNASSVVLIRSSSSVPGLTSVNNNDFSFNFIGSNQTGPFVGVSLSNGAATSSVSIGNNNFSSLTYSTTGTGDITFIQNSATAISAAIFNNTWNNLNVNNSANTTLIYDVSSTSSLLSVYNNSVVGGYTLNASSGAFWACVVQSSGVNTCLQTVSGNRFSNLTSNVSGSGSFIGISVITGAVSAPYPRKNIFNNVISDINYTGTSGMNLLKVDKFGDGGVMGSQVYNNFISNINSASPTTGMEIGNNGSASYTTSVFSNTICNINSSAFLVYGAYLSNGGSSLNFYKNKLYNLSSGNSGTSVKGVYVGNCAITNIYNNLIGNITASVANADNSVIGIQIQSGSRTNILHNSVYLNASSSGATFGSSAIYAVTSVSVNLRNNIFVNLSTSNGAGGRTVAFRRNTTTIGSYSSTSNNNIFYAGIPATNRLIEFDGTNSYQTLTAWQTAVSPKDANSFTENTPFTTTVGANANFLDINPSIPTFAESGGTPIGFISDDYIGTSRNVVTPDIGAWENDYLMAVLPIELTKFDGACGGNNSIAFEWETASELNNDFFTLERFTDMENWETVAKVKGAGNSTSRNNYSFVDKKPANGQSYYRLRQTDFNKKEKLFSVVSIGDCKSENDELILYPNPASTKVFLKTAAQNAKLEVYNSLAEKVIACSVHPGENSINVAGLTPGVYLFKLINKHGCSTHKVIINTE